MTDLASPPLTTASAIDQLRALVPDSIGSDGPTKMLPSLAYTSPEILDWERRHLFAGTWTCLGRIDELLPAQGPGGKPVTQRAAMVGDIAVVLTRAAGSDDLHLFANLCRHRGHELLQGEDTSERATILCTYHAWVYDLDGSLRGAPGFREVGGFEASEHGLVELPVEVWHGWVFAHAIHPKGSPEVPDFDTHVGDLEQIVGPYRPEDLVLADRHSYEVAANWKVIAENYHECYHCPLIHPELCAVSPPDSGDNYHHLQGAWIGGAMVLRDGMKSMTLTGEQASTPLPGVDPERVEYVHFLPNLLISPHPDYVMTHRLVPLAPDNTWIECSWFVLPSTDGANPEAPAAVEFWDITNKQDFGACESVQKGLANPHFQPGPFAPNEDAVADLVSTLGNAYLTGVSSEVDLRRPAAHLAGEAHLVGDDDHRHAGGGELLHDVEHVADHLGVERRGRFVEQHHLGVHAQRAGDRHALLLAAGQPRRVLVGLVGETDPLQQLHRVLLHLRLRRELGAPGSRHHVLEHGHVREQVELLEAHADVLAQVADLLVLAPRAVPTAELDPGHLDRALRGVLDEVHTAQHRRLAGAGPAEDDDDLAAAYLHVHALDDLQVPEGLVQVVDAYDDVRGAHQWSPAAAWALATWARS